MGDKHKIHSFIFQFMDYIQHLIDVLRIQVGSSSNRNSYLYTTARPAVGRRKPLKI